jgi:hypothetical protein
MVLYKPILDYVGCFANTHGKKMHPNLVEVSKDNGKKIVA